MGQYDFVGEVMSRLGVQIKIKTIKMKPGKPLIFGVKGEKLFFGLPGNPVSTMVSFEQFVRPAILKMSGAKNLHRPFVEAELLEDIKKKPGRRHFVRGIFTLRGGRFFVTTTGDQGSGILMSMVSSNCLIILPDDESVFKAGSRVMIQLIHHDEMQ
jgi:molybdopterin molybdotransferase